MDRRSVAIVGLLLAVVASLAACGSTGGVEHTRVPPEHPSPAGICGTATRPPARFAHVIVIVLENHSYHQLVGPGTTATTPYLNLLADRCGLATDYHSVSHPSLPNYLAITAGSTFGLSTDCECSERGASIFSELAGSGQSWGVYAESMPHACQRVDSLGVYYTFHHNPPVFFRNLRRSCPRRDLPLGTPRRGALASALANGTLPAYVFIAPDRCHDMHDCPVVTGDAWVSWWIDALTRTREYRHQATVIFITVDEGTGGTIGKGENCAAHPTDESCHVPLIVVSRYVTAHTRVGLPLTHYSLMRATAELLGVAPLRNARTATDLLHAFGLR